MTYNVGPTDRIVRTILGVVLSALFFILETPWDTVGFVGPILLVTAVTRWCGPYALLGINTCGTGDGDTKTEA